MSDGKTSVYTKSKPNRGFSGKPFDAFDEIIHEQNEDELPPLQTNRKSSINIDQLISPLKTAKVNNNSSTPVETKGSSMFPLGDNSPRILSNEYFSQLEEAVQKVEGGHEKQDGSSSSDTLADVTREQMIEEEVFKEE